MQKSAKIGLSESIFYVKKFPNPSKYFSLKNISSGPHFLIFFNFQITLFTKIGLKFCRLGGSSVGQKKIFRRSDLGTKISHVLVVQLETFSP